MLVSEPLSGGLGVRRDHDRAAETPDQRSNAFSPLHENTKASLRVSRPTRECVLEIPRVGAKALMCALGYSYDLVRPRKHRWRDREAERLSRFEIDHQLELGGLLHG